MEEVDNVNLVHNLRLNVELMLCSSSSHCVEYHYWGSNPSRMPLGLEGCTIGLDGISIQLNTGLVI